jgi:hypothetical protein
MNEKLAEPSIPPRKRVVLLGASNVTRSFGTFVATAKAAWSEPLNILAVHGHGRSYGSDWSRVLARKLPGIIHTDLWQELQRSTSDDVATFAIVTDIGNDILYEFDVPLIASWVEQCLDRLAAVSAQTVVTGLPVANIFGLSEIRYKFFRNLFMPGCSLSLREAADRAIDLDERVRKLAAERSMTVFSQPREWYGLDPIHLRFGNYPRAWHALVAAWTDVNKNRVISRANLSEALFLRSRAPARIKWFDREYHVAQPCAQLPDGTTISMY